MQSGVVLPGCVTVASLLEQGGAQSCVRTQVTSSKTLHGSVREQKVRVSEAQLCVPLSSALVRSQAWPPQPRVVVAVVGKKL